MGVEYISSNAGEDVEHAVEEEADVQHPKDIEHLRDLDHGIRDDLWGHFSLFLSRSIGAAVVHTKRLNSKSLQLFCRPLVGFSGSLTPIVGGTTCMTLLV